LLDRREILIKFVDKLACDLYTNNNVQGIERCLQEDYLQQHIGMLADVELLISNAYDMSPLVEDKRLTEVEFMMS